MALHREFISLEASCSEVKIRNLALLSSIAEQLISIVQPDAEFNPETVYVKGPRGTALEVPITYAELSEYFRKATGKYVPVLFETSSKVVESHQVMVNREWLSGQIGNAERKLDLVLSGQAYEEESADFVDFSDENSMGSYESHLSLDLERYKEIYSPSPMASDMWESEGVSKQRARALREIGERLAVAESLIVELRSREKNLTDENRSIYNELRAKDRKIQEREEEIASLDERLSMFSACFNPRNPLHPQGLYEAFQCWQHLTDNGMRDPSGPGGRGALKLVLDWLVARGETEIGTQKKPSAKAKRLAAIVGWRGQGSGAIRSR